MPRVTFSKAYFDAAYTGGYGPHVYNEEIARAIAELAGFQPGQSILILGGGHGYMADYWRSMGLGPIVTIDDSPHIQATKGGRNILAENAMDSQSFGRIKQALGLKGQDKIGVIFTEDVLTCYDDSEITKWLPVIRPYANRVIHWVSEKQDINPDNLHNWKTPEEWKVIVSPDLVIPRGSDRIL